MKNLVSSILEGSLRGGLYPHDKEKLVETALLQCQHGFKMIYKPNKWSKRKNMDVPNMRNELSTSRVLDCSTLRSQMIFFS